MRSIYGRSGSALQREFAAIFLQLHLYIEMEFESSLMEGQLYEHREVTLQDLEETEIWDNSNDTVRFHFISFLEFCIIAVSVNWPEFLNFFVP